MNEPTETPSVAVAASAVGDTAATEGPPTGRLRRWWAAFRMWPIDGTDLRN